MKVAASRFVWVTLVALALPLPTQSPVFRTSVDVVRIDVLATRRGLPIPGLTSSNFRVWDDGSAQRATVSDGQASPLDIRCLFDQSMSVRGDTVRDLKAAFRALSASVRDGDTLALWTFSHRVDVVPRLITSAAEAESAIDAMATSGGTALFDALYVAAVGRPPGDRRCLTVLFSDGKDTRSWLDYADVRAALVQTGIVLYSVAATSRQPTEEGLITTMRQGPDTRTLEGLAVATGGRAIRLHGSSELADRFAGILEEMRSRYVVSYALGRRPSPGWHSVKIELAGIDGNVLYRKAYFVEQ